MKKTLPAFLAALLITTMIGAGMFLVGQNALGASIVMAAPASSSTLSTDAQTQIEQALVQYQTREAQYQNELQQAIDQINTANQQLDQANQQIQQYQNLLSQLQASGLITISSDGIVTLNQPQTFNSQFGNHPEGRH